MKTALFPGSFDPFTIGHESIVRRALKLFDLVIIAIGNNTGKTELFDLKIRMKWIRDVFENEKKVSVETFEGLTIDYCKQRKASFILRGLRTSADFEYERAIAQMNRAMDSGIETVFLLTKPEHTHVTSTIVRDVIIHGGNPQIFLPDKIKIPPKK